MDEFLEALQATRAQVGGTLGDNSRLSVIVDLGELHLVAFHVDPRAENVTHFEFLNRHSIPFVATALVPFPVLVR